MWYNFIWNSYWNSLYYILICQSPQAIWTVQVWRNFTWCVVVTDSAGVLCNIGYPPETRLKLKSREILFVHNMFQLSNRFDILHRARQYRWRALCTISKRLDNWPISCLRCRILGLLRHHVNKISSIHLLLFLFICTICILLKNLYKFFHCKTSFRDSMIYDLT